MQTTITLSNVRDAVNQILESTDYNKRIDPLAKDLLQDLVDDLTKEIDYEMYLHDSYYSTI